MRSEAVAPETVQMLGVVDVIVTGRPELAVTFSVSFELASSVPVIGGKLIVWLRW